MMQRRVISRSPRSVLPNFTLPQVGRACFLLNGAGPGLTIRDFISGIEIGQNGSTGFFTQHGDAATGGVIWDYVATGNDIAIPPPVPGPLQKAQTAMTLAVRCYLRESTAGAIIWGHYNSIAGANSAALVTETGPALASAVHSTGGSSSPAYLSFTLNTWQTFVLRWATNNTLSCAAFDDNGNKINEVTTTAASGTIDWGDTSQGIALWQGNTGMYDFVLMTPVWESDRSVGDLIRRRQHMFSPMRTGPIAVIGTQTYTSSLSAAASGSAPAFGLSRGVVASGSAKVYTTTPGAAKAAVLTESVNVGARLSAPARVKAVPAITTSVIASLPLPKIAHALSAAANAAPAAMARALARVLTATVTVTPTIKRGFDNVHEAGTVVSAAILNRFSHLALAAAAADATGQLGRRLVRTADSIGVHVAAAVGRAKFLPLPAAANVAAAIARRLAARTLVAATQGIGAVARAAGRILAAAGGSAGIVDRTIIRYQVAAGPHVAASLGALAGRALATAQVLGTAVVTLRAGVHRALSILASTTLVPARNYHQALGAAAATALTFVRSVLKPLTLTMRTDASIATTQQYPAARELSFSNEQMSMSGMINEKLE